MKNLEKKSYAMYVNLCNTYRGEEEKEETEKEEFSKDFAEDLTAALLALFTMYSRVTADDIQDLVGFTHILNRLAIQYCTEN